MDQYLEQISALRTRFDHTTLATEILWAILICIAIGITYYHRKQYNFRPPLAMFTFIGGLYVMFTILMKAKANILLNSFEPSFTQSEALGGAFVNATIDMIWMHGLIRSIVLVLMSFGVLFIAFLRIRKKVYAPTHWIYGFVVGLFICSLMITKLKYDFEVIFTLFN